MPPIDASSPNFFLLLSLGAAVAHGLMPEFAPALVILVFLWVLVKAPILAIALAGAELREAALNADMPAVNLFSAIQFPILHGVPEFEASMVTPPPSGIAYQRFTKLGTVEEELRLEPTMISYRTSAYRRWGNVTEIVEQAVFPILKNYLKEAPTVSALIVQYIDRFFSDTLGDQDCSELFEPDSPWIVSSLTKNATLWHSHCGLFENAGERVRRLINVNIDVSDRQPPGEETPLRSVAILTLCSDQFKDATQLLDTESFPSEARTRFKHLHTRSKHILLQVLSAPYRRLISLTLEGDS
jgi:uncharacterized protein (TIGR04255 family)